MILKEIFSESKKLRLWSLIFIGCIIVFVIIFFINSKVDSSLIVAPVKSGSFEVIVTAVGELNSSNNNQFLIPVNDLQKFNIFEVSVSRLNPEGTIVDSGDFIVEFDKSALFTRLADIEKEITKATAEYEEAKLDTTLKMNEEREKKLDLQNAVDESAYLVEQVQYESQSAIRTANNNLEKSKRELERKLKKYKQTQMQVRLLVNKKLADLQNVIESKNGILSLMDKMTIYSSSKGMVVYEKDQDGSRKKQGSKVQIFANPVVATIPDLRNLISKAFVNEIDVNKVKPGQPVKVIADAFMNKPYKGKVLSVANMGTPMFGKDANMFEISIEVENTDLMLKPSMRTNNFILTASYQDALFIPLDALQFTDSLIYIFKMDNKEIVKQQINIGEANENEVVVFEGITKDEKVLLSFPENEEKYSLKKLPVKSGNSKK